jgi:hypothetical protein
MAKTVIEDYVITFEGKEHSFKEFWQAMKFCDAHGLYYPDRLYEKEGQDHVKALFPFAYDRRVNRERQQAHSREMQKEQRNLA